MTDRHARSDVATAVRHARTGAPTHRTARGLGLALTATVALAGAGVTAVYARLDSNIETASDIDLYLGEHRPERDPDPTDGFGGQDLNVLVMGTDSRDGANAAFGSVDGMRSDSTFIVHLASDRSRVDIVSIPRDTLVPIPSCLLADGTQTKARTSAMFNDAFRIGSGTDDDLTTAAACTRRTVEQLTGVRIDEHLVIKMDGVQAVIDTLDGIPMCIPEAMSSPDADLELDAGAQVLDGRTSIAFLRARTGTGNGLETGSDLGRLDRQHQFLSAVVTKVQGENLLAKPVTLMGVLDEGTRSLSASPQLANLTTLLGLAFSLRGLDPAAVTTVTAPNVAAPQDKFRVVLTDEAEDLWVRLAADQPLTGPVTDAATESAADPGTGAPEPGAGTGTGAGAQVGDQESPATGGTGASGAGTEGSSLATPDEVVGCG